MVYEIHLKCDANVSDDTGGNVYALVMRDDYDMTNINQNRFMKQLIEERVDESFVYNIGSILADPDAITHVSGILQTYASNINNNFTEHPLILAENYSVYVLAIDANGNSSPVYKDTKLRGNIAARDAPLLVDFTINVSYAGNIEVNSNLTSDVYFEYYIASFTNGDETIENLDTFFTQLSSGDIENSLFVHSNINDGFNEFGKTVEVSETHIITNTINNINDVSDYEPLVNQTKPIRTYMYAFNVQPHNTSAIYEIINPDQPLTPKSVMVENIKLFAKDYSFEIEFDITFDPSGSTNIASYISVFENQITDVLTSGDGKKQVLSSPTKYDVYDNPGTVAHEITGLVNGQTYYVYVCVVDTLTGEMSPIQTATVKIQNVPLIVRDSAFVDSLNFTRFPRYVSSNIDQYIREQSIFDMYVGILPLSASSTEVVDFMTTNASGHKTVHSYLNQTPDAETELWPIPQSNFSYYQYDLLNPEHYKPINFTTDATMYVYIEDNLGSNVLYTSLVSNLGEPPEVNASLRIVKALDDGFRLQCANADIALPHHVMVFDEFQSLDKFEGGMFLENVLTHATHISNTDNFLIRESFDNDANISASIENGTSYYIYAYAVRTSEGVYAVANLDDQIAVHIPVISYVHVNFDVPTSE